VEEAGLMGTYAMMALAGVTRAAQPQVVMRAARSLDRQLGDGEDRCELILVAVEGGPNERGRVQRALRATLEGIERCPRCGDTVPCPADRLAPGGTCPHPDFEPAQEALPGAGEPNAAQSATLKAVRLLIDASLDGGSHAVMVMGDRPRFEVVSDEDGALVETVTVLPSGGLLYGRPVPDDVVDAGVYCGATVALGDVAPEWAHGLTCVRRDGHEAPHRVEPAFRDGSYFEWQTLAELEGMARKRRVAADAERRESAPGTLKAGARDGAYAEMYGGAPPWPGPRRWVTCPECDSEGESTDSPCTNLMCPSHERRGTRVEERIEAELLPGGLEPIEPVEPDGPDLVTRMRDARECLRDVHGAVHGDAWRGVAAALRVLEDGIEEGLAWRLQRAAARELVDGEPHVCSCGDCEEAPFSDRCRFEMALRALVR
jgi:hypothetical protein